MTKTLATSQASLMKSAVIAPLILAELTVYTNKAAGTVSKVYYWSYPHTVQYNWEGAGDKQFDGVIQEISVPGPSMPFPLEQDGFSSRAILDLTIANGLDPIQGNWRWRDLRQKRILGSELVLAELLIPPGRRMVDGGSAWWDLRDLAGTEHTVLFRGECEGAGPATNESFSLTFATKEPRVPKIECLSQTENDPKDFGAELPIVYGSMEQVPLRNLKIGHMTTSAEYLPAGFTGDWKVTDATGFPTSTTFDIICGSEIIECSDADHMSHTVTISARGEDGTADAGHLGGDQIMELVDEVVMGIAGHFIKDMTALYVANPFNQELVRVDAAYLYRRGDQRGKLFGFPTGTQFSTVTIEREEFVEWLIGARASARVTVQPDFDLTVGGGASGTPNADPDDSSTEAAPSGVGYGVWTGTDANPIWTATAGASRLQLRAGWIGAQNTDTILRFRFKLQATLSGWTSGAASLRCKGMNLLGCAGDPILLTASGNAQYTGYTKWLQPSSKSLDNLRIDNEEVVLQPSGATGCVWTVNEWTVEAETNPGAGVSREIDTEIEAAATGYGLQFYCDCDGVFVPYLFPSTSYAFEEGATGTWEELGGTQTRSTDESEGTYAQQLTSSADTAIMQYLSPGGGTGIDLQSQDDFYRIDLKADNVDLITSARIWFADSGTGTTVPASRIELEIPPDVLVEDEYITFYQFGVRYGTPDVSDCDCIGMEIIRVSGAPSIIFDDLRVAAATNANYDDAPGTLIETMPDIIRHFAADHCELGHGWIDTTTFGLANTNLGSNVHALIATGLGITFDEIVGRMAFEGRCNVARVEGSTSTQLKLSTADASGDFPATDRTFEQFFSISESLFSLRETGSRFRAFWDWQAFLGSSERGFAQVSRADPDVDDTGYGTAALVTRENRYLRQDFPPYFFLTIRDEATAENVLQFFVRYASVRSRFSVEVPVYDCFDLDPGDTVDILPEWDGYVGPSYTRKCLVLAMFRTPGDPSARIELVQVT